MPMPRLGQQTYALFLKKKFTNNSLQMLSKLVVEQDEVVYYLDMDTVIPLKIQKKYIRRSS
jgi:hypothetical protein